MPVGAIFPGARVPIVETFGGRGNWFSGTATSGDTGDDVCLIGNDDETNLLLSFIVTLASLTPGATVTVRLYRQILGVEREVQTSTFTVGADPDGSQVVSAAWGIHEQIRAELQSTGADDGAWVDGDFMLLPI